MLNFKNAYICDVISYCAEAGGSDVNPDHEPHMPKGGITAEMQVSHYPSLH